MLIRPRRHDDLPAAIALYESQGWTRAGQVTVTWPDGRTLTEYVYLGPETGRAGQDGGSADS